jgi:hypothetical protein
MKIMTGTLVLAAKDLSVIYARIMFLALKILALTVETV